MYVHHSRAPDAAALELENWRDFLSVTILLFPEVINCLAA